MTVTQSFAGISSAQALEDFDPRFEQLFGSHDGAVGGNALSTNGDGNHLARFIDAAFADAQYVQWINATGAGGFNGGALRISASGDAYGAIENGATLFLNRYASGSFAASIDGSGGSVLAPPPGTLCRFEFGVGGVAGAWRLLYDGATVASGTDNNLTTGSAGVAGFNGVGSPITAWEGGDLVGAFVAGSLVDGRRLKSLIGGALAT